MFLKHHNPTGYEKEYKKISLKIKLKTYSFKKQKKTAEEIHLPPPETIDLIYFLSSSKL